MSKYEAVYDKDYVGFIVQRREEERDIEVHFVSGTYGSVTDAKLKAQEFTEIDRIINKRG